MFAYISKTLKKRHSLHNPSLNMKFTLIFSTAFLASISFVNGVPVKAAVPAGLEVGFIVFDGKNTYSYHCVRSNLKKCLA